MANEKLFDFVVSELTARKAELRSICKAISPKHSERLYSWVTKVIDRKRIKNPSVHRIQEIADWLRANPLDSAK